MANLDKLRITGRAASYILAILLLAVTFIDYRYTASFDWEWLFVSLGLAALTWSAGAKRPTKRRDGGQAS